MSAHFVFLSGWGVLSVVARRKLLSCGVKLLFGDGCLNNGLSPSLSSDFRFKESVAGPWGLASPEKGFSPFRDEEAG